MKVIGTFVTILCSLFFVTTNVVNAKELPPKLAAVDVDKDGKLSKDEIIACAKKKADKKTEEAFQKLDVNGDASLTKDELKGEKSQKMALNADTDGNGVLSKEEVVAFAEKRAEERVSKKFQQVDKNGDGFVTAEEAQQSKAKAKEKEKVKEDEEATEAEEGLF